MVVEGCGGGGYGSGKRDKLARFRKGRGCGRPWRKLGVYHTPDFVAGGSLLADTGATGVASAVGVASGWFFFLRPKRPRRPFLIWASASGAKSD